VVSTVQQWSLNYVSVFAVGPNYVSKPTAGDGLQSFRLLPAGSGLTRR
jgi:hypothetical protein